ncbi:hypothetical protein P7K49_034519 [Saguinus oedipus]|uniref:Uncharacterized protein n=1 Tax=Saguinus oedipus TaxID=9490 RepID=A0ABQ9TWR9_SAGOE|nr:hypothetical protein P7K49_034519 [Saguinus oedipus]
MEKGDFYLLGMIVRGLESHKRQAFLVARPILQPIPEQASLQQHIQLVSTVVYCSISLSPVLSVKGVWVTCTHLPTVQKAIASVTLLSNCLNGPPYAQNLGDALHNPRFGSQGHRSVLIQTFLGNTGHKITGESNQQSQP